MSGETTGHDAPNLGLARQFALVVAELADVRAALSAAQEELAKFRAAAARWPESDEGADPGSQRGAGGTS